MPCLKFRQAINYDMLPIYQNSYLFQETFPCHKLSYVAMYQNILLFQETISMMTVLNVLLKL